MPKQAFERRLEILTYLTDALADPDKLVRRRSPNPPNFCFSIVLNEPANLAASAITALATSRFHADVQSRLAAAVDARNSPQLKSLFEQQFG